MKMLAVLVYFIYSLPIQAQGILSALEDHQKNQKPSSTKIENKDTDKVQAKEELTKSKSSKACEEEVQRSLPLKIITSLILEKNGKLELSHNPRSGELNITSPQMISNCASMINWKSTANTVDEKTTYSVEAQIREGKKCKGEGKGKKCTYKVTIVKPDQSIEIKDIELAPTMSGFESCLKESGVIKDNKIVENAIYPSNINESFKDYKESGDVLFLSHGLSSSLINAKYGKFVEIDGCEHYEKISADGFSVKSYDDIEYESIMAEKEKVQKCGDYQVIADFIEKYQDYADELDVIRDQLILESAKKSIKAITDGNYTEDDLKVINDLQRFLVTPRINLARRLYSEAQGLKGEEKTQRLEEMKKVLKELAPLNKAPYISEALVKKLEKDGNFEVATSAYGIKALIVSHAPLGTTSSGTVITPDVASAKLKQFNTSYAKELEDKKEEYEVATGQVKGKSKEYAQLAAKKTQNIQIRTNNFNKEIAAEYSCVRPGGCCYRPYRNTQRCIQDSLERIQELEAKKKYYNELDAKDANKYLGRSDELQKIEKNEPASDYTVPQPRIDGYTFNFQGYEQPGQASPYAQFNPQQNTNPYLFQNPYQNFNQNPYQNNGLNFNAQLYTNPYMNNLQGNGPYRGPGAYPFNYQGQVPGQQPGQWNPYQAYQFPNFYGM